jgi:hypothetical protein
MSSAAVRSTVLECYDDVLEIGRKLRTRNGAQVPQISFVGKCCCAAREAKLPLHEVCPSFPSPSALVEKEILWKKK